MKTKPTHADTGLIPPVPPPVFGTWRSRRQRNETRRQRLVDAMREQRPRRWITSFEIADEVLRDPGSIVSKRERRPLIYTELARAIAEGRFERDSHVHWLGGHGGRMTRRRLVTLARSYSPDAIDAQMLESHEFLKDVVAQLVFPVAAVRRWLRGRGRPDPLPAEFGVDDETAAPTAAPAPPAAASTEATPAPRHASVDHIRNALRVVYDEAKSKGAPPPNVKKVRPLVKVLLEQQELIASENRIGEIAHEEEFKNRRRPSGKTLKSERRPPPG
jgi:hypothetical protein